MSITNEEYQLVRRGLYGTLIDGREVLSEAQPDGIWWLYSHNYTLVCPE